MDMLWANMQLHTAADPQTLIERWHKALKTDGYVMFSALGPDTVMQLHRLYADLGWGRQVMPSRICMTGAICWCIPALPSP